ncbi:MAG: hydroxyacylglutathione hydrolase [Sterolibacterium sp.]|nr:hydroxyacylglutathione hydrolase [Sterolibacterium sp.]
MTSASAGAPRAASKNTTCASYRILPLAAVSLPDNYIWLLHRDDDDAVVVVDPGEAQAVLDYLQRGQLRLTDVLITHHHADHTGGIPRLRQQFPQLRVYAAANEPVAGLTAADVRLHDGDWVELPQLGARFQVLAMPGHTLGHVAYHDPAHLPGGVLFSGDTLFSAGCGRVFEGSMAQMQQSLARLRALPANTQIYCAHEYTAANLRFAQAVEPKNTAIADYAVQVVQQREQGLPTLPSTLALECRINPFLRWDAPAVQQAAIAFQQQQAADGVESVRPSTDAVAVFTAIRRWKNTF